MKLIKVFLNDNDCYKTKRTIKIKGLMLHSVGCPQPKAQVFVKNWNGDVGVCVHAFVDGLTGTIYQTLPWNHRAWHCGGAGNNTHIGIEMCEPDCIKYVAGSQFICTDLKRAKEIATTTYNASVELFAQLCNTYNLNPLTDIVSHKEAHKQGIASNHGDPEHLWQQLNLEYTMNGFRQAVQARMLEVGVIEPATDKKPSEMKCEPFRVIVTTPTLNVRCGASVKYPIVTKVYRNEVYTIVETENGWGKLKSGAGWINLSYTDKI